MAFTQVLAQLVEASGRYRSGGLHPGSPYNRYDTTGGVYGGVHGARYGPGNSAEDPEVRDKLERLFRRLDRNNDEYLDRQELGDFVKLLERIWELRPDDPLLAGISQPRVRQLEFVQFVCMMIERAYERLDPDRTGLTR